MPSGSWFGCSYFFLFPLVFHVSILLVSVLAFLGLFCGTTMFASFFFSLSFLNDYHDLCFLRNYYHHSKKKVFLSHSLSIHFETKILLNNPITNQSKCHSTLPIFQQRYNMVLVLYCSSSSLKLSLLLVWIFCCSSIYLLILP